MSRTKEKNLRPATEFRQGMRYIENSTLGIAYSSLRINLGVEKAGKLAFLFRQLNDE